MENECVLEERIDYYRSPVPFVARVYKDGRHTIQVIGSDEEKESPWFKGEDGKPWFPKRSNFVSLIKQGVKEGDYDAILAPNKL